MAAFSGYMSCIDIDLQHVFPAMAKPPHSGFGPDNPTEGPFPIPTQSVAAAAAAAAECVDQRRVRRRVSNRESARRSRARKQRRLGELRGSAALLERGNRDLAARAEAAHRGLALALLANAALRAEAAALSRRLAAARRALVVVLDRLDTAGAAAVFASIDGGECCLGSSTDIIDERSLVALPTYELLCIIDRRTKGERDAVKKMKPEIM